MIIIITTSQLVINVIRFQCAEQVQVYTYTAQIPDLLYKTKAQQDPTPRSALSDILQQQVKRRYQTVT